VTLGLFYLYGIGVEKDADKAVGLSRKAEIQNSSLAWFYLGICFLLGVGVLQNKKKALEYFKKTSVEKDIRNKINDNKGTKDSHQAFCLGIVYSQGLGVPADQKKAKEWFEISAKEGNEYAKIASTNLR